MLLINLRFFLLLTFDLPGLVLEMENGSPLRMVEGGRSVEHPQDEGEKYEASHSLESQSPAVLPEY